MTTETFNFREGPAYMDDADGHFQNKRLLLVNGDFKNVRCCISETHRGHEVPAEFVVHWVTGPIDYCAACAARMVVIADAMGFMAPKTPIDRPEFLPQPEGDREIAL